MSAVFHFPAELNEVPLLKEDVDRHRSSSKHELIVILTKDNPTRLLRTLPYYERFSRDVILIDDSTTELTRRLVVSKFRRSVSYHGRAEQTRLLRRLGLHHSRFTSPLGKVGWTLGFCRNYAVLLSLALGADLLLMVDDDIIIEDKRTVDMSFRLLGQYAVVGTRTVGMYDDSIIGHLARRLGEVQYDYITGQYAGLNLHSINYYFPNVYNEDLIFYAFQGQGKEFARSGTVRQLTKKTIGNFDSTLMFQEEGEILLIGAIEATTRGNESLLLQSDFWSVILRDRIEELCELAKLQTQHGVDSSSHPFNVLTKYHSRLQPASFVSFYRKYRRSIEPWRTILTKANNRKIEVEPIAHI